MKGTKGDKEKNGRREGKGKKGKVRKGGKEGEEEGEGKGEGKEEEAEENRRRVYPHLDCATLSDDLRFTCGKIVRQVSVVTRGIIGTHQNIHVLSIQFLDKNQYEKSRKLLLRYSCSFLLYLRPWCIR